MLKGRALASERVGFYRIILARRGEDTLGRFVCTYLAA